MYQSLLTLAIKNIRFFPARYFTAGVEKIWALVPPDKAAEGQLEPMMYLAFIGERIPIPNHANCEKGNIILILQPEPSYNNRNYGGLRA